MRRYLVVIILLIVVFAVSCRKEKTFSDNPSKNISLSTDTIAFDTVFTAVGSSTRILMVYNNNSDNLKINSIRLEGGSNSPYSINVDGQSGTVFTDNEIYAKDSLYVFVKVTINPNNVNNPFFVEDRLIFNTNGNESVVHLTAYGQNANYIIGRIGIFPDQYGHYTNYYTPITDSVNKDVHWTAERPYVIYNVALIDSDGTLTIEPGTHVYFHNGAGLWAWSEGQLIVNGTAEEPVVFQGDRLEHFYDNQPGQWDRIWLMEAREGHGHSINHAIIRNGFIGLQIQRMLKDNMAAAYVNNTIIENHTGIGVYANCYSLGMSNFVVGNCGNYCVALTGGGEYVFTHGTIANYWTGSTRKAEALLFNNLYQNPTDGNTYAIPFNCEINNSIVYGSRDDEFGTDFYPIPDTNYVFRSSLIRTKRPHDSMNLYDLCVFNEDPKFKNTHEFDFHLDTLSAAIGIGNPAFSTGALQLDLDGVTRDDTPDAGAYQYVITE
ncbi:MAG: hypothetical protein K6A73_05305 [Bacteroidales bacterium]|nr:hypothetical protein [Bacteroidales bacterium]